MGNSKHLIIFKEFQDLLLLADFHQQMLAYKVLLRKAHEARSRQLINPRNYKLSEDPWQNKIETAQSKLNLMFGMLEKYLHKLGKSSLHTLYRAVINNPHLGEDLFNQVLQDLECIKGRLTNMTKKEFNKMVKQLNRDDYFTIPKPLTCLKLIWRWLCKHKKGSSFVSIVLTLLAFNWPLAYQNLTTFWDFIKILMS